MSVLIVLLALSLLGNVCSLFFWLETRKHRRKVEQAEELDLSYVDVTLPGNDEVHILLRPNMKEARNLRAGFKARLSDLAASEDFLKELSISHAGKQYLLDPDMENCLFCVDSVSQLTKGSLLIEGKIELL